MGAIACVVAGMVTLLVALRFCAGSGGSHRIWLGWLVLGSLYACSLWIGCNPCISARAFCGLLISGLLVIVRR